MRVVQRTRLEPAFSVPSWLPPTGKDSPINRRCETIAPTYFEYSHVTVGSQGAYSIRMCVVRRFPHEASIPLCQPQSQVIRKVFVCQISLISLVVRMKSPAISGRPLSRPSVGPGARPPHVARIVTARSMNQSQDGSSGLEQLRAEVERLRAENDALRQRVAAMGGKVSCIRMLQRL